MIVLKILAGVALGLAMLIIIAIIILAYASSKDHLPEHYGEGDE